MKPELPVAPGTIEKGVPLKTILGKKAIEQLGINLQIAYPAFDKDGFVDLSVEGLEPLSLTQRSKHIAIALRKFLPQNYLKAIEVILISLTPPLSQTEDNGLTPMFYMPHCDYISKFGIDPKYNGGTDPFEVSMGAQYELTQRFTCEFSIRPFLINDQKRTLKVLHEWMKDPRPHVRRLCSEGTRSRLPWASRLPSFIEDPSPVIPILEHLKNDPILYVRRSVANHVGDIAKDHPELALTLCEQWLDGASHELKWVIRHALRHPSKKGNKEAIRIRKAAK